MLAIDHVQIAMPVGGEAAARAFFGGLLGLPELPKPAALAGRGGCWFAIGALQLHLGVEADFRAAAKAHVALRCDGFDALCQRLGAAGHAVIPDTAVDGLRRGFTTDPFGNRLELIAA